MYHVWDRDKKHFTHEFDSAKEAYANGAEILVCSRPLPVSGYVLTLEDHIPGLTVNRPLDQALSLFSALLETHFALDNTD
jgi:hypothetical protein